MKRRCPVCVPRVVTYEGADHTGLDAIMRCTICGTRTASHVECHQANSEVRRVLLTEWNAGRVIEGHPHP